ncbi:putative RNA-binding Zn-ribbon protein involved in translation (DUF1610 family) [Evansella vedderi]|uniref:RNA-binding Zn-ribbon protein involved in translation (DUF1610 family) n=1 Tax=Evansella vedderi TaxID=38282 RepID=A0ABT9ZTE0_9BACI|nr:hypothetical protein [Evansella vedderi]MDQ0254497.1 putative RNA-binding Zn-ribbon protein involved in translation (DUF1610 family) [Evansella vedderi]
MALKLFRAKKYDHCTHVECPSCEEKRPVEDWNNIALETYGSNSPDIRTAANKKVPFPYQCPNCYMGYSAYLLKFD